MAKPYLGVYNKLIDLVPKPNFQVSFGFSPRKIKETIQLPIGLSEIQHMTSLYPVVILEDDDILLPYVITGIDENKFVSDKGIWRHTLLPKIVFYYPFNVTVINSNINRPNFNNQNSGNIPKNYYFLYDSTNVSPSKINVFDNMYKPTDKFMRILSYIVNGYEDLIQIQKIMDFLRVSGKIVKVKMNITNGTDVISVFTYVLNDDLLIRNDDKFLEKYWYDRTTVPYYILFDLIKYSWNNFKKIGLSYEIEV